MHPISVLTTLTGRDRPGVTTAFFAALAAHDVDVRDVEQVVIRDRLVLAALIDLRGDPAALRNSIATTAAALGMEWEMTTGTGEGVLHRGTRTHVIVIGHPLRAGALSHVTQTIADTGSNIESIIQLGSEPVSSLEMLVRTTDPVSLRAALVQAAEHTGVDIAVEPAGLQRRAKRLVVLDVDSTLIRDEAIDVLAERAGVGAQVGEITERTMAGELDFTESLRSRVALLEGLPEAVLAEVRDALRLTPGARTLVRTLRRLGYLVGVVSGGFTYFTDRFVDELGLDFAAANELEIVDGVLTGRVLGNVIDRPGKAAALREFADKYGVPLAQTVAIGDGANDIDMLEQAGLGVAFNAKAVARGAADAAVNLPYLDTVLFVLGITRDEALEAAEDAPGAARDAADA
jgi:phosphoserine phosphatase